jgi:hypothetical protein
MRKALAISAGLLLGLAAIASCGGGGSKGSGKNAEFTNLYEKGKTARLRVTYEQRNGNGNPIDTWIYAQDGDTKKAYIEKSSKWVVIGETAYTCEDLETTPTCEEVPGGAASVSGLVAGFAAGYNGFAQALAEQASGFAYSKKSNTTIAGRDAVCATVTLAGGASGIAKKILDAAGAGEFGWESCLDKQTGVVLRVHDVGDKDDNDQSELIATKVEDPRDDDFATPTTTSTSEASSSTTEASSDTTEATSGDSTVTTAIGCAVTVTLPPGETLPGGITVPCVTSG